MAGFSLQALHNEIEADPEGLGYKDGSAWIGDQLIADLINAKNYAIDPAGVEMEAVRAGVSYDAYNTLAIDEQEWIRWMTPNSGMFQVTADMKEQLTGRSLTSNGTAGTGNDSNSFWSAAHRAEMSVAMLALIEIPGSRAEVLWGAGQIVSVSNVGGAENL